MRGAGVVFGPTQQAELPRFRESWSKAGLSTAAIDADAARAAVRNVYRAAGQPEPKAVVVLASPMACLAARGIVLAVTTPSVRSDKQSTLDRSYPPHLSGQLGAGFWGSVWHQVWAQLRAQMGDDPWGPFADRCCADLTGNLRHRIRDGSGGQLRYELHARPFDHEWDALLFRDQLWGELAAQLESQLRHHISQQLREQLGGAIEDRAWDGSGVELRSLLKARELWQEEYFVAGQDAPWLSFYDFLEHIGTRYEIRVKGKLDAYKAYARACGWMYPYRSIAFVSDRAADIHFDAHRRLHNPNHMAVRFRDGWGVHAWHGTRVPAWLIEEPNKITPQTIEMFANVELRRAALEIYGFERYIAARRAKVVALDELHGQPRRLFELNVGGERVRIVEVTNGTSEADGTRRKFHLGAVAGDTPADAIAASYGIAPAHYREAVRT